MIDAVTRGDLGDSRFYAGSSELRFSGYGDAGVDAAG